MQQNELFQLIYMSSLVSDAVDVLPAILNTSVKNNRKKDITGILLCVEGNVVQVLEGAKCSVLETFKAIESDKRHRGIFVLIEQTVELREFADWSMGFKQITMENLQKLSCATQAFNIQQDEISRRSRFGVAQTILKSFADGTMGLV